MVPAFSAWKASADSWIVLWNFSSSDPLFARLDGVTVDSSMEPLAGPAGKQGLQEVFMQDRENDQVVLWNRTDWQVVSWNLS